MPENIFFIKFQSYRTSDLKNILENPDLYVLDARHAASTILKERNIDSEFHNIVQTEILERVKVEAINETRQSEELLNIQSYFNKIPIGKRSTLFLLNGNRVHIRRLNQKYFHVTLDTMRGDFLPVIIYKIKNQSTLSYFLFPNVSGYLFMLAFGIFLSIIQGEFSMDLILGILFVFTGFQLLLSPISYNQIIKEIKKLAK